AQRHDIRVELAASADGGVIAVVMLPFSVLEDGTDKSAEGTPDVEEFSFADFTMPDTPTEAPAGSAVPALAAGTRGRDSGGDDPGGGVLEGGRVWGGEGGGGAPAGAGGGAPAETVDDVAVVEPVGSIEVADVVEPVEHHEPFAFESIAEPAVAETDVDA